MATSKIVILQKDNKVLVTDPHKPREKFWIHNTWGNVCFDIDDIDPIISALQLLKTNRESTEEQNCKLQDTIWVKLKSSKLIGEDSAVYRLFNGRYGYSLMDSYGQYLPGNYFDSDIEICPSTTD